LIASISRFFHEPKVVCFLVSGSLQSQAYFKLTFARGLLLQRKVAVFSHVAVVPTGK